MNYDRGYEKDQFSLSRFCYRIPHDTTVFPVWASNEAID